MGQQFRRRRIHDIASPMMVPRRKRSGGCGAREASPNATPEPKMLWQLLFRRLLRYRMGASLHMLPQGARVTCYPGAPMSFFIPGRACHMFLIVPPRLPAVQRGAGGAPFRPARLRPRALAPRRQGRHRRRQGTANERGAAAACAGRRGELWKLHCLPPTACLSTSCWRAPRRTCSWM